MKSTYYVLDAQGNQLSTYEHIPEDTTSLYQLAERVMYGSSRLGINTNKVDMLDEDPEEILSLELGNKLYEMSNHLGNVLTVINDVRIPQSSNSVDVDGYLATIVSTADYSPFGVQLDGRTVSAESYRFGFNGMEKDDELKGKGNSYDFGARMYDSRLGRWLTRDAHERKYPAASSYVFCLNSPLLLKDPDGNDAIVTVTTDQSGHKTIKYSSTIYLVGGGMTPKDIENIKNAYERYFQDEAFKGVDSDGVECALQIEMNFILEEHAPRHIQQYKKNNYNDNRSMGADLSDPSKKSEHHLQAGENVVLASETYFGVSCARKEASQAWINANAGLDEMYFIVMHELLHLYGLSDRYDFINNKIVPHPGHQGTWMAGQKVDNFGADLQQDNINCLIQRGLEIFGNPDNAVQKDGKKVFSIYKSIINGSALDDCDPSKLPSNVSNPTTPDDN